jgi:hypothetical protein
MQTHRIKIIMITSMTTVTIRILFRLTMKRKALR